MRAEISEGGKKKEGKSNGTGVETEIVVEDRQAEGRHWKPKQKESHKSEVFSLIVIV